MVKRSVFGLTDPVSRSLVVACVRRSSYLLGRLRLLLGRFRDVIGLVVVGLIPRPSLGLARGGPVHRRPVGALELAGDGRQEGRTSSADLHGGPTEEEPVEPKQGTIADVVPNLLVDAVPVDPVPVELDEQEAILVLGVDLLVGGRDRIVDLELLKGGAVHLHLLAEHATLAVDLSRLLLAGFDRPDVLGEVGDLGVALPEDLGVPLDLGLGLMVDLVGDTGVVVTAVLGGSVDELLEVTSIPLSEALLPERHLLGLLLLGEGRDLVHLRRRHEVPVGLRLRRRSGVLAGGGRWRRTRLPAIPGRLPGLQVAKERREELVVVHGDLLRSARTLRFRVRRRRRRRRRPPAGGESIAVVLVEGVVLLLALAFGRVDPVGADLLLSMGEVLSVPFVGRVRGELLQIVDPQLLVPGVELSGLLFAVLEDGVDVVLGQVGLARQRSHGPFGLEDVLGPVLNHVQQFALGRGPLLLGTTLLDHQLIQSKLLRRTFENLLLDGVLRDEPEDDDLLGLADPMSSIHGLQIRLWVPVAVVQDDDVGRR